MVHGKRKQVNKTMEYNQQKVYLQTRLRNLKRKYSKVIQHADFAEEAIELKAEIDGIERDLNNLQ